MGSTKHFHARFTPSRYERYTTTARRCATLRWRDRAAFWRARATAMFQRVGEAYETLKDSKKRDDYDVVQRVKKVLRSGALLTLHPSADVPLLEPPKKKGWFAKQEEPTLLMTGQSRDPQQYVFWIDWPDIERLHVIQVLLFP